MISANEVEEISSVIRYSIIENEVDEKPVIFQRLVSLGVSGILMLYTFKGPGETI